MKSTKEIEQRINELEKAQKNWVDIQIEIDILRSAILLSKEQIKSLLRNQIEHDQLETARMSIWILSN